MVRMEEGQPRQGEDSVMSVTAAAAHSAPQPLDVLWRTIVELFKLERPTEAQIREVQGIASLALATTLGREPGQEPGPYRDLAECASLYAYRLGYYQGQQASART